jgi:polyferredoxin
VVSATTTAPAPVPDTTAAVLQQASEGGFYDTIHLSAPLAGVLLFLILTGILFVLARRGLFGIPSMKTRPALALAALFGLGISLVITCFLAGGVVAGTTCALIYMGAGTLLAAGLWHAGVMSRRMIIGAVALGAITGFVFLAPIMPMELGGIVNAVTGISAPTSGVVIICTVIAVTLIVGRTFCGTICPVGSLQELAYAVPVRKITVRHKEVLEWVRLAVFVATVIAALSLIDLMAFTGLYDLFSLTLSRSLLVAAGIVLLSAFLYRPVCRILCPFGVLFSLGAEFSLFRLRRTETCISCKKCEKICPAATAGKDDSKRECYLCGRCTDACPKETALVYSR